MNSGACSPWFWFVHRPLVVGIATLLSLVASSAQPIHSVNALGYFDASFAAGSNLIANPFFAVDNSVSNLLRGVPPGSRFVPWNRALAQFDPPNQYTAGGWTYPLAPLIAPDGGFLVLPATTKISFVGQPWAVVPGPRCLTYPAGDSVFGWFPATCCAVDCDVLGSPPYGDGLQISIWNRQTQAYDSSTYFDGLGWIPPAPSLALDEAALFSNGGFDAQGPFAGVLGNVAVPTRLPWVDLLHPQRVGTNLTFSWNSPSNISYAVFCSTNLHQVDWRLVQRGTALPTNGFCTVTVPDGNPRAYYRLQPDWGGSAQPALLVGRRVAASSAFAFQLYAPVATNYVLERSPSFTSPSWQVISNFTAGPSNIVSISDPSATGPVGYYRVSY